MRHFTSGSGRRPHALGTRYTFSRAWHPLHIFPRLATLPHFCAWHLSHIFQFQFPRLPHEVVFARFLSASCFPALVTGYTFVHWILLVYQNYYFCWLVMTLGCNHCILNNCKVPLTTTHRTQLSHILKPALHNPNQNLYNRNPLYFKLSSSQIIRIK